MPRLVILQGTTTPGGLVPSFPLPTGGPSPESQQDSPLEAPLRTSPGRGLGLQGTDSVAALHMSWEGEGPGYHGSHRTGDPRMPRGEPKALEPLR